MKQRVFNRKYILIMLLLLVVFLGSLAKFVSVRNIPVKVKCVDVAFSFSKYGTLYRHHYLMYPDGHVSISKNNNLYYEVGKTYIIKVPEDESAMDFSYGLLIISGIAFFIGAGSYQEFSKQELL